MMMNNYKKSIKKNHLTNLLYNSLINLPTPKNINNWWNFGSILGLYLLIQIISGFFLSMHYCPNINYAFESIIHIMKDVKWGWMIRLIHMNGASIYFLAMYIHIGRGIYYYSFKSIPVWFMGILILLLSMASAFLGYVLPWGQMSFWGATVITNLLSAIPYIGQMMVEWIWGGFSINNATLNRFFSIHFILPLIVLFMVILHLFFLHINGSNNPLGFNSNYNKLSFHPYFTYKDIMGFLIIMFIHFILIIQSPYWLGDPDNFMYANPMKTPEHIKPEWYFLFAYSILRSIPNKLGGVLMLFMSIIILMILPMNNHYLLGSNKFYPLNQIMFWNLFMSFMLLTWLGSMEIEYPYMQMSQFITLMYFLFFLINPFINKFWDQIIFKS